MLTINQLKVSYQNKVALDISQSIEIMDNDKVGVIGSNGAGKTTLMKSILGLVPYQGEIKNSVAQLDIAVHMQFNEYSEIVPIYMVMEMVLGCKLSLHKQAMELIEFFEFEDCLRKRYKNLSGGQKQRLTLILVMCKNASLTLLDEVTSGLDFVTRQKLMDKLVQWYDKSNQTLLITSHYYEELDQLTNKILYLESGKLVAYGDKQQLFKTYCGESVVVFKENEQLLPLLIGFKQIVSPLGTMAYSCNDKNEENALISVLIDLDVNFRRSNNDIEMMTLNALSAYNKGVKQ